MVVEGKKLKAYIGKLKECLDNLNLASGDDANGQDKLKALPVLYRLVLAAELCQRGIILPDEIFNYSSSPGGNDGSNDSKLFDAITNTAGKEMLHTGTSSTLKPPLIAGAAIVSAMVADKLASLCLQIVGNKMELPPNALLATTKAGMEEIKSMVTKSLQRCHDVGDDRLHLLLTLTLRENDDQSKTERKGAMAKASPEEMALLFQRMAFGNCLRATQFTNPDQPPMYKRSLDACLTYQKTLRALLRQYERSRSEANGIVNASMLGDVEEDENDDYDFYDTPDAIVPLENLIRIAQSKQNTKRVSELSLRLCQSYIANSSTNMDMTRDRAKVESQLFNEDGLQLWNKVSDTFGASPHRDGEDNNSKKNEENIGISAIANVVKAQESLTQFNEEIISDTSNDDTMLLYKLMEVRVGFALEDAIINEIKENRYVASRNRTGLSMTRTTSNTGIGGGKSTTREAFAEEVRRELTTGKLATEEEAIAIDYDGKRLDEASEILRDAFVSLQRQQLAKPPSLLRDVCLFTQKQVHRCTLRAQSIALQNLSKKKKANKGNVSNAVADAWKNVLMFIEPILDTVPECAAKDSHLEVVVSMPLQVRILMKVVCEALMATIWMTVKFAEVQVPIVYMRTATQFLSTSLTILKNIEETQAKELLEREGKVVRTNSSSGQNKERLGMEKAFSTGTCFNLLSSLGSQNDISSDQLNEISIISNETIKAAKMQSQSKLTLGLRAKFGLPFLQFLSCWSGLHGTPWSFCNVSQARSIVQYTQDSIAYSEKSWGRNISELERILLLLGEADAECGFLQGGFTSRAKALYEQVMEKLSSSSRSSDPLYCLLKAHCQSCLAKISLKNESKDDFKSVCLETAQQAKLSMEELQMLVGGLPEESYFHVWRTGHALCASFEYHISFSRQLVAEAFLGASKHVDAQTFLSDAVKASPKNYDVTFAYGSFCLRMALYITHDGLDSVSFRKKAQAQLVKAAKLNTKRADPFALLGIWYEVQNGSKRAAGCYSKALLIDPSHPVAGRGIIRLKPSKDVLALCKAASDLGTFQNGWAWKSLGDTKAFAEGDDEKAILCYQQALRCHDVENPMQHRLGIFFRLPSNEVFHENQECSDTWSSLGGCYRRLGKFSASLRAFQFAHDIAPGDLSYFCSWAQVELELGLLDESMKKFELALDDELMNNRYSAAYGLASCMLLAARRKSEEGKFGDALFCLKKGIKSIQPMLQESNEVGFFCAWKTLGDLYSHGFILPPSVFSRGQKTDHDEAFKQKVQFIEKGAEAYKQIIQLVENRESTEGMSDIQNLLTTTYSDLAINTLLCARVRGEILHEGSGLGCTKMFDTSKDDEISRLIDLSIQYFTRAIESNESVSLPWCGIGCALVSRDPILAQHAFCRALQLDKASEDAWANLSLLQLDHAKISFSEEAVDALTQVADTPLMWIVRGLLLEKNASEVSDGDISMCKAADAYRASLQITRHEAALFGLSLTCRRLGYHGNVRDEYALEASQISLKESDANLRMFLDSSGGKHLGAKSLSGVYELHKGNKLDQKKLVEHFSTLGLKTISSAREQLNALVVDDRNDEFETMMNILKSCEAITNSLLETSAQSKQQETATRSKKISQARQRVIQDPANGCRWLQLSKELLKAVSSDYSNEGCKIAKAAIEKTKQIFVSYGAGSSMLHPTSRASGFAHRSVPSKPIDASLLSEIMSLSHWVQDLSLDDKEDTRDLQRSAMLDPTNRFARAKIDDAS